MKKFTRNPQDSLAVAIRRCLYMTPLLLSATMTDVHALTVKVQSGSTSADITTGFRYLIQEDRTYDSIPGTPAVQGTNLSLGFHNSQSPVVANGHSDNATANLDSLFVDVEDKDGTIKKQAVSLDPSKRYFISILPDQPGTGDTFAMGAGELPTTVVAGRTVLDSAGTATIVVQPQPIPTAQISLFVHEDNAPINNTPDLPAEGGLEGFNVRLFDAGGGYGAVSGQMSTDAFGNPLGTTYNPDGSVLALGNGSMTTGPDGTLLIKNLAPGKYTIFVDPPNGQDCYANDTPADGCWAQTATIEGTRGNDAWVKANEPSFFAEFGPPGHHVFIGFVKKGSGSIVNPAAGNLGGGVTVTGQVVNNHISRPPEMSFFDGAPVDGCWVGINDVQNNNVGIYSGPCDSNSNFSIPGLKGNHLYELAVWDKNLDRLFATRQFTTPQSGALDLASVPVFDWFSHVNHTVFFDVNENGYQDDPKTEPGLANITTNLRFRDGRIYASNVTDANGRIENPEVFPFFSWQIAEVDFARYKATGVTSVTDNGGLIDPTGPNTVAGFDFTYGGVLEPQWLTALNESSTGVDTLAAWHPPGRAEAPCRTVLPKAPIGGAVSPCIQAEGGAPVLLQSFQGHMGLTTELQWGKKLYGTNENGGITGIAHYASTRAEDLAKNAAPDNWEPGIPHVQVALYQDKYTGLGTALNSGVATPDKQIDDINGDSVLQRADVDNFPQGNFPGSEDVDRDNDHVFDYGDAINIVWTDSFDDNLPVGCGGDNNLSALGVPANACFDGLRPYQQTRDGVFDGGYGFFGYHPGGMTATSTEVDNLPPGFYIVESPAPAGYQIQMEEDKNVTFGDTNQPSLLAANLDCVGEERTLPAQLSLFPGTDLDPSVALADTNPSRNGTQVKQCDMKQVQVRNGNAGNNAAADFYMFTEVPVAANVTGIILDDLANTIDPNSPAFGEKYAPPHLPVSFRDWKGNEILRVYSDQNGTYNALLPSTYNANVPNPSGYSPNMLTACMNDPGPITKSPTTGAAIAPVTDPFFDRRYSQFCYTFQYMPGSTTHLDTPVLPVAAFAGPSPLPVDCEQEDQKPAVYSVSNGANGPWVPAGGGSLTIVSQGTREITNPAYQQLQPAGPTNPKTITRDFGFGGTKGTVKLGNTTIPSNNVVWATDGSSITVTLNSSTVADGEYQLSITRGDNRKTTDQAVIVTKGGVTPIRVAAGQSIQDAIDAAPTNALITVAPGTYNEFVVMDKQIKLQGWGPATVINAAKGQFAERLQTWRDRVWHAENSTFMLDPSVLLPGQAACPPGPNQTLPGCLIDTANNEPVIFGTEEAPGILVLASDPAGTGPNKFSNATFNTANGGRHARIDGFTIENADTGGGIFVNGYAQYLEIGNNVITGNVGTYGGGIRAGDPGLVVTTVNAQGADVLSLVDAKNDRLNIHHNAVTQNGNNAPDAVGGGIALYNGTNDYTVANNLICGNFSQGHGGGFGQLGLARNLDSSNTNNTTLWGGLIQKNTVIFNQSFQQQNGVHGGGLYIAGQVDPAGGLSEGTGSIKIDSNLIQGNQAGAGSGAGIRAENVNGTDVSNNRDSVSNWNQLLVVNNMIVNNSAGLAGGGISLKDVVRSKIVYNTIAHNDSTATAAAAFEPGDLLHSQNQPAGLAFEAHSSALNGAMSLTNRTTYGSFARPVLEDNIIWQNRSFHFSVSQQAGAFDTFQLLPLNGTNYWDFGVPPGNTLSLSANRSILTQSSASCPAIGTLSPSWRCTGTALYTGSNNSNADPLFVVDYVNRDPNVVGLQAENPYAVGVALDEGGNQIDARFGPLTRWLPGTSNLYGDYHINSGSPAIDTGSSTGDTTVDFDGQTRNNFDKGADEYAAPAAVAIASVTPTSLSFGNQNVNTQSTAPGSFVTLTNSGPVILNGINVSFSGSNSNDFSRNNNPGNNSQNCGTTLNVGSSCRIYVRFRPSAAGSRSASLDITAGNAVVTGAPVALSGTGVVPPGTVSFTSASRGTINFGVLSFGNLTGLVPSVITLRVGTSPVTFTSSTVTGSAYTKLNDTCSGNTIAVNATCTITVQFNAPNGVSLQSGALTVNHNGNGSPQQLSLIGF